MLKKLSKFKNRKPRDKSKFFTSQGRQFQKHYFKDDVFDEHDSEEIRVEFEKIKYFKDEINGILTKIDDKNNQISKPKEQESKTMPTLGMKKVHSAKSIIG